MILNADRVILRRAGFLAAAVGMAISGEIPRDVFHAMFADRYQAEREYARYLANKRMSDYAAGALAKTL